MTVAKAEESLGIKNPLPLGWRLVRLGDLCDINPSRHAGFQRAHDILTTFVPMSAVDEHRGVILNAAIRPFSEVAKGYTFFNEGDVLFAKITPCMQNGKHAIVRGLLDGIGFGSTEFHVIRPRVGVVAEWIHRFIRQPHVLSAATNHFTGTVGQQRVPESFLASLEIPLPSIDEQERIMRIVNVQIVVVEKARAAAEVRLEAAEALTAAYLRQVFPKPGQELPDGWLWEGLGDVCVRITNGTTKLQNIERLGLPVTRIETISSSCIDMDRVGWVELSDDEIVKYSLESGDILFSHINSVEKLGNCAIFTGNNTLIHGMNLLRLQVNRAETDPLFLLYFLRSEQAIHFYRDNARRAIGQASLNTKDLSGLNILLPSTITKQKRIASILNEQLTAVEKIVQTLQQELETINTLPAALLRRAFTGGL